jgi:hypothetical protein
LFRYKKAYLDPPPEKKKEEKATTPAPAKPAPKRPSQRRKSQIATAQQYYQSDPYEHGYYGLPGYVPVDEEDDAVYGVKSSYNPYVPYNPAEVGTSPDLELATFKSALLKLKDSGHLAAWQPVQSNHQF